MTDYIISGKCPTCKVVGEFKYIGDQEDGEGGFVKLYVCQNRKCDTSTTGRSIVAATTGQQKKAA